MDVFSVKRAMHSSILCVLYHSVVGSSCSVTADISITPLILEGLSGSCLLLPCIFTVREGNQFPGQNAAAVWIRNQSQFGTPNSKYVVFNTSRTSNDYPMKIIGDVNQRNCTTEFNNLESKHRGTYFFRVEDGRFKSTASCSPVKITVRDSPWRPSMEVSGDQTESEEVTLTCSAVTPCPRSPPELTWNLHHGTSGIRETNPDGTLTTKLTRTITLTSSHHGLDLTCSAAYPVDAQMKVRREQTTITLNVTRIHFDKAGDVAKWLPAAIVLVVLIAVLILIWYFKFRRVQIHPPQVRTIEDVAELEATRTEVHYEAVRFSGKKPDVVHRAQEETVYSQVQVSSHVTQNTHMFDIYAQVKKT